MSDFNPNVQPEPGPPDPGELITLTHPQLAGESVFTTTRQAFEEYYGPEKGWVEEATQENPDVPPEKPMSPVPPPHTPTPGPRV